MPASKATFPTSAGSASVRRPPSSVGVLVSPLAVSASSRARRSAARTTVPASCSRCGLGAHGDDPAEADHDDVVGDDLDLVEQVRGEQDGAAAVGVPAEQVTHPPDPGRVQAVGGLVEDQHLGVTDQRGGDAESLTHAEGVLTDPT